MNVSSSPREADEHRSDSGDGIRVMRVGTHALMGGSRSTLRERLRQHRGNPIFRLLVGQAMIAKGEAPPCPSWDVKGDLTKAAKALETGRDEVRNAERPIEEAVSRYIGAMPFLWLDVSDEPSLDSRRDYIERNAIALLSNYDRPVLDPASDGWLGRYSDRALAIGSELWNQRHVTESHAPEFVATLSQIVDPIAP